MSVSKLGEMGLITFSYASLELGGGSIGYFTFLGYGYYTPTSEIDSIDKKSIQSSGLKSLIIRLFSVSVYCISDC